MFLRRSSGRQEAFSFLNLQEGEYYFEDSLVVHFVSTPGSSPENFDFCSRGDKGKLKLCSYSIIFVPENDSSPIIRFPFEDMTYLTSSTHNVEMRSSRSQVLSPTVNNALLLTTNSVVLMHENMKNDPYRFIKSRSSHLFQLQYASLSRFLPKILRVFNAYNSKDVRIRDMRLKDVIDEFELSTSFDSSWLEDLQEKPLVVCKACRILPLFKIPGHFVVTRSRVYFQTFSKVSSERCFRIDFDHVRVVQKRRHLLSPTGIEIFMHGDDEFKRRMDDARIANEDRNVVETVGNSASFVFDTSALRDSVFEKMSTLVTCLNDAKKLDALKAHTQSWQAGLLSNLHYLLLLNMFADRSLNDITAYPVFPWVIADYVSKTLKISEPKTFRDLSKPIGALNRDRLVKFVQRYREMKFSGEERFLYGTHYSTPGFVLFYLVRAAPEYMLKLQNGKFDKADRMFCSIADSWQSVLELPTDVKEVIPEFYLGSGEWLLNLHRVALGRKQDGTALNDVALPPWANDSAATFVQKSREALECDFVSERLHSWIDLIFGYKQTGDEAIRSLNLFYPLTYAGSVNLEDITDIHEKQSKELQISEFGQIPRKLFFSPHVRKSKVKPEGLTFINSPITRLASVTGSSTSSLSVASTSAVSSSTQSNSSTTEFFRQESTNGSSSSDPSSPAQSSSVSRSNSSPMFPSSTSSTPTTTTTKPSSDTGFVDSSFGKTKKTTSLTHPLRSVHESSSSSRKFGWRILEFQFAFLVHRDVVGVCLSKDGSTCFSVSQDATLKIYSLVQKRQMRSFAVSKLALSSVDVSADGNSVVMGCWDNKVYVYYLPNGRVVDSIHAHDDAVSCVRLIDDRLYSASWDASIRIWKWESNTVGKLPIMDYGEHETEISSFDVLVRSNKPSYLVSGDTDGRIFVWDCDSSSDLSIHSTVAHSDEITSVRFSTDGSYIISCSLDGMIRVVSVPSFQEVTAINTNDPIHCAMSDGVVIISGGRSGDLRVHELHSGNELRRIRAHKADLKVMAMDSRASVLVTSGSDGMRSWKLD